MSMRNISPEAGSVSIDSIASVYTRDAAGKKLNPKVCGKQVTRYLHVLTVFSPNFNNFKDPVTGELNGEPITDWHLDELQDVRKLFFDYRKTARVQMELAKRYSTHYYNQGA